MTGQIGNDVALHKSCVAVLAGADSISDSPGKYTPGGGRTMMDCLLCSLSQPKRRFWECGIDCEGSISRYVVAPIKAPSRGAQCSQLARVPLLMVSTGSTLALEYCGGLSSLRRPVREAALAMIGHNSGRGSSPEMSWM